MAQREAAGGHGQGSGGPSARTAAAILGARYQRGLTAPDRVIHSSSREPANTVLSALTGQQPIRITTLDEAAAAVRHEGWHWLETRIAFDCIERQAILARLGLME